MFFEEHECLKLHECMVFPPDKDYPLDPLYPWSIKTSEVVCIIFRTQIERIERMSPELVNWYQPEYASKTDVLGTVFHIYR